MSEAPVITPTTTIKRSRDLLDSNLGEEVVMLSIERGEYYGLNQVGSVIWEELTAPSVVADIITELLPRYDVVPEQGEADVLKYLNKLHGFGIIEIVEPGDTRTAESA